MTEDRILKLIKLINERITSREGISKHEIHMITNVILGKANEMELSIVKDMEEDK